MSDKKEKSTDAAPKKGKGMMVKAVGAVVLLGAGGGGAYGLMAAGILGGGHAEHKKEDNNPKLIRKGEEDPYAPKGGEGKEAAGVQEVMGDGGSEYRTVYFVFDDDFTSNLKNSEGLIQVGLAASTRRDGRVLLWMKKHELAIRSAMLAVLADTPEEDAYSLPGKEHMQKRLTDAINKVLTEREGFGGVDSVYFKTFLVQ